MSMISFPLTDQWLDHVQEFADTPWCRDAFDEVFVRHGWAVPREDGGPAVGWMGPWPLGDPADEAWHLVLGAYPGCADTDDPGVACDEPRCHEESFLALPLAYFAEGESWGPIPAQVVLDEDARDEDFTALYDEAARLLRTRLGDPLPRARLLLLDPGADRQITWERGKSLVTLFLGENLFHYSVEDWIGIEVRPRHWPAGSPASSYSSS
ncbi:hypothetical protein [Streptomyces chattanoogensis]|uniref:hypothetical protein n=1 Tax=Streptomyces chattanoogensis TaxID=66876 RepID=UPI00369ACA50